MQDVDAIFKATRMYVLCAFVLMLASVCLSYVAYAGDLAVSGLPWKISCVVMLICCIGPCAIYLKNRKNHRLALFGVSGLLGIFSSYYFFGILPYFYFFLFAPMLPLFKWSGLIFGGTLTAFWIFLIVRSVQHTINHSRFVAAAFRDRGEGILGYEVQRGMRIFEKHFVEPSPFPKPLAYVVLAIAPFSLVLPRILSKSFGTNGVLFVLAALSLPMSLWLIGALVRIYMVTVALPLRIERERNVRVVVEA
ncbi:hypothetical protein CR51_25190 [Caballeronia megalochromosomata]|nr:hypothetical protein CR51_25190 [Caballeronia megalochromosomata]